MIFHENHPSKLANFHLIRSQKPTVEPSIHGPPAFDSEIKLKVVSKSIFSLKCGFFNDTNMGCNVIIKSKVKKAFQCHKNAGYQSSWTVSRPDLTVKTG